MFSISFGIFKTVPNFLIVHVKFIVFISYYEYFVCCIFPCTLWYILEILFHFLIFLKVCLHSNYCNSIFSKTLPYIILSLLFSQCLYSRFIVYFCHCSWFQCKNLPSSFRNFIYSFLLAILALMYFHNYFVVCISLI